MLVYSITTKFKATMSINSLMISRILPEYTSEYIANVFWNQNIAKVSSITLFPYLQGSQVFQRAYVTIDTWSDSEVAYNFIQRLHRQTKTRIVHHSDLWWPVHVNTHIAGYYYLYPYTTTFPDSYFYKQETEVQSEALEEKKRVIPENGVETEEKCIQCFDSPQAFMTWKDAVVRLDLLRYTLGNFSSKDPESVPILQSIKDEIDFIENQIFSKIRLKSQNITLRPHQIPFIY